MADPAMHSVYSSSVSRIGYDLETQELHVQWRNGKRSIYDGVPADVADTVSNAWSIGKAVNDMIKNQYEHRYG